MIRFCIEFSASGGDRMLISHLSRDAKRFDEPGLRRANTIKKYDFFAHALRWQLGVASCSFILAVLGLSQALVAEEGKIDFNRQIRPILSNKCFKCHGPDSANRQAGLRLDSAEFATHPLDSGETAIVPGKPDESELTRRIYAEDDSERMPPSSSQKTLSEDEKTLLKKWIASGAEFMPLWSFIPPQHIDPPQLANDNWSRNSIDRFILQRLRAEQLVPSPEAERRTLIRRVTFDLTGLPPSLAEITAFVNDDRPDAYERVVDRLLASPRFGERMATPWLDLARYADSDGYEKDGHRQMWPYRDWVIRAFNSNMPFDQFTIEQLAGDLLPEATRDQKLASAFNRNNATTSEGGADPDEYAAKYAIDRLTTTADVWLGLTMQCAECHDHKFDPLTNEDFYSLFAFFNQIPEVPLYEGSDAPPSMAIPTREQASALAEVVGKVSATKSKLEAEVDRLLKLQPQWENEQHQVVNPPIVTEPNRGLVASYLTDPADVASAVDAAKQPAMEPKGEAAPHETSGLSGKAWLFDGKSYFEAKPLESLHSKKGFSYAAWVKPTQQGGVVISNIDTERGSRGFDLFMQGGQAIVHLIDNWPTAAIKVKSATKYNPDEWIHVLVVWDGGIKKDSVQIYFDGEAQPLIVDVLTPQLSSIKNDVPVRIGSRANGESAMHGAICDVRVYDHPLAAEESLAFVAPRIRPILEVALPSRQPDQARIVAEYYRRTDVAAKTSAKRKALAELEKKQHELDAAIPKVRIMQQASEQRPTHVLVRGDYRNPGKEVTAAIPAVLGKLRDSAPNDRLALARWIVGPSNPLTARVTVNRLWEQVFGRGIVATPNDFGSQGEAPSHPELLDWLATDFIDHGWDVKAILRQMVTSTTYRQLSRVTPEAAERDPQNRLLARAPRQRLSAEMIRDNALSVSGLLQEHVGGPSVYPYHPSGLWEEMAWADSPWKSWPQDHGPNLYRRGLYTFWKRSVLHPVMSIFDAPNRNLCTVNRSPTNTPLQAFVTLNEDSFVEAARSLAIKMIEGGSREPLKSIDYGFMLVTARPPEPKERKVLVDAYQRLHAHFAEQPEAASALLKVGDSPMPPSIDQVEAATWTTIAQIMLNLDEAITKD
jgi:hypothetical protein